MKIGFIGTGNMASSIILGLINTGYNPANIWVTNRTMAKAEKFAKYKVNVVSTSEEVIANSDTILLGMKPDGYKPWLDTYSIEGKKIISIGAGITSQFMKNYTDNFVITMPNTPSKLCYGSTLIVESDTVTPEVLAVFEAIGKAHLIKEEELDVYTLVTGCSPAYFFSFVANMSEVLSSQYNLDEHVVNDMLIQVLNGSGAMLNVDPNPKQLCDKVCSPGGITIEVVNHLNKDLPDTFKAGFDAAIKRTNEMKN
ncbi:pyrroline-5-carboxylate reductase [Mollicutes bacterium LVI A0078]|nr:pyrroline-5-carboxylate reductase [Mollicutes bacterium LVI A0075]WOO90104.1 pyrroline-5-carboxylate reductase [Mollicutes bacterium LVI A0078]